jgi:hypothetical protein
LERRLFRILCANCGPDFWDAPIRRRSTLTNGPLAERTLLERFLSTPCANGVHNFKDKRGLRRSNLDQT